MSRKRLLILEDDPLLVKGLSTAFELEEFEVTVATDLRSAKELYVPGAFDVFVLDMNLPDGKGTDILRLIRKEEWEVPVIFLTALSEEETIIKSFELGASDYIRKPFSLRELLARTKGLLGLLRPDGWVKFPGVEYSLALREIKVKGQLLQLNRRQFDLLVFFLQHREHIITREKILESLSFGEEIVDRTIDSHLSHLRRTLKAQNVETIKISSIYGVGYKIAIAV